MINPEDRTAITDVLAMHGHLVDGGQLDRLGEVFTDDVLYDVTPIGAAPIHGLDALRAAARALGTRNPVGHHVTNVVLTRGADGTVEALSKGLGVNADGSCGSVTYEDLVVRTGAGWRIRRRTIIPRRSPLGR
jgi:3-phenylpropionate/cinnamic acid dioxygenase small subunit